MAREARGWPAPGGSMGAGSLERIAALIDGRLRPSERDEALAAVARCEPAYEAFSESLAFLRGGNAGERGLDPEGFAARDPAARALPAGAGWTGPPGPDESVWLPLSTGGRRRAWLMGPAVAVIAALALARSWTADAGPSPAATRLAAELDPAARFPGFREALATDVAPVLPGVADAVEARAFGLGVAALRMEVYARASSPLDARRSADTLLRALGSLGAEATVLAPYRKIAAGFDPARDPVHPLRRAWAERRLDRWFAARSPVAQARYRLGKCVEAARLAAAVGDVGFLTSRAGLAYLDLLDRAGLSGPVQELAAELRSGTSGPVGTTARSQVTRLLRALLEQTTSGGPG